MKNRYLHFVLVVVFSAGGVHLQAQSSLNASGGEASGAGGSISYSIGQLFYEASISANGSLEAGVQHAYEIETLAVDDLQLDKNIQIYPNPTADFLNIRRGSIKGNLEYELYNMQGKIITRGKFSNGSEQVNMKAFPVGMYIIKIISREDGKSKVFKVLKK